jgi:hypothetical protein
MAVRTPLSHPLADGLVSRLVSIGVSVPLIADTIAATSPSRLVRAGAYTLVTSRL